MVYGPQEKDSGSTAVCLVKRGAEMEQKELIEQIRKLYSENPGKFIKIRDAFDDIFEGRELGNAQLISDREFERLRYKFQDIDVPFSWCATKEAVYQLQKAVLSCRSQRSRYDDEQTGVKKSAKPKKKGIFGLFK